MYRGQVRAKVTAAAGKLCCRLSCAAAMLHRNQTDTVTFMVSKPRTRFVDPCFPGILDGLELALSAQGQACSRGLANGLYLSFSFCMVSPRLYMAGLSPVAATQEQKAALRVLARGADRAEADRAPALLLTLEGWTSARTVQAFGVREDRVRLWRSAFARGAGPVL